MKWMIALVLPILSCNTVNDSVLNKAELTELRALNQDKKLNELNTKEQIVAKKYIKKVLGSILLLEEEYAKDQCLVSDDYANCMKAAKETLKNAKKALEKEAKFAEVFNERIPLNVVYSTELNRNRLLALSSFKSEIENGMTKEQASKLKEKIEQRQKQEQETASEKLKIEKTQIDPLVAEFKEFLAHLAKKE